MFPWLCHSKFVCLGNETACLLFTSGGVSQWLGTTSGCFPWETRTVVWYLILSKPETASECKIVVNQILLEIFYSCCMVNTSPNWYLNFRNTYMGFYGGIWVIIFETAKLLGFTYMYVYIYRFTLKTSIQSQDTHCRVLYCRGQTFNRAEWLWNEFLTSGKKIAF